MATPRTSPVPRAQNQAIRTIVFLLLLFGVGRAMALNIDDIHIAKQGRAYEVQMTFDVIASADQVMKVLTDYGFPDRLDPEVTKRDVISQHGAITRVRTEIRACVIFFCKDIALTQDVTVIAYTIQADVVPGESDFHIGYFRWSVSSSDTGGASISFKAIMEPAFFIPPVIGGFFTRRKLRQKILATAENLESEAAREPSPVTRWN